MLMMFTESHYFLLVKDSGSYLIGRMDDRRWWRRLVLLLFLGNSLVIRMRRRQTSREG
jgi:hypothetical protein